MSGYFIIDTLKTTSIFGAVAEDNYGYVVKFLGLNLIWLLV
jgi:hypothetical protein